MDGALAAVFPRLADVNSQATRDILLWVCAVFSVLIFGSSFELLLISKERGDTLRRIESKLDAIETRVDAGHE